MFYAFSLKHTCRIYNHDIWIEWKLVQVYRESHHNKYKTGYLILHNTEHSDWECMS